jgi:predicted DCC family thiol-disulfide oxidoreductase YuxK
MSRLYFLALFLCILSASEAFPIQYPHPQSKPSSSSLQSALLQVAAEPPAQGQGQGQGVDWDWEKVADGVFKDDQRPVVLFDGVCNLCNGGVNFAIDRDEDAKLRFASLQTKVAQSLLLRSGHSPEEANIVMVTKDNAFFSSDAVSRICIQLDAQGLQWLGQMGQSTPAWIREPIFKYVSSNRYYFGENDHCRIDFDGIYTGRFVSDPTDTASD